MPVRSTLRGETSSFQVDNALLTAMCRALRSTVIGSLAGVPVVVVPTSGVPVGSSHLPLGLALMGAPGTDLALLDLIL